MEQKFFEEDKKKIKDNDMGLTAGSFALVTSDNDSGISHSGYVYCRDSFQGQSQNMNTILFVTNKGEQIEKVAHFINIIEKKLGHEKITVCGKTNVSRVMWIKVAEFWKKPLRRSLFTALLRAGMAYDPEKDNFEKALETVDYLRQTKPAVNAFLNGRTWFKGNENSAWYNTFYNIKNKEKVEEVLTKKPVLGSVLFKYALKRLNVTKDELEDQYKADKAKEKEDKEAKEDK